MVGPNWCQPFAIQLANNFSSAIKNFFSEQNIITHMYDNMAALFLVDVPYPNNRKQKYTICNNCGVIMHGRHAEKVTNQGLIGHNIMLMDVCVCVCVCWRNKRRLRLNLPFLVYSQHNCSHKQRHNCNYGQYYDLSTNGSPSQMEA